MSLKNSIGLLPTASDVTRFNVWFDQQCASSGVEKTLAADLKLCVNEVLANLISYGFSDTTAPMAAVEIALRPGYASAKVIDNGIYFDLRDWPPVQKNRDLMTAPPGGFGIALIKERATEMSYKRVGDLNEFEIVCEGKPR
jgi:anti-sigma regulatory factor (Ser/Thr protein kinase)